MLSVVCTNNFLSCADQNKRFTQKLYIGLSPSGKATDFDSVTRGFESRQPSHKHRFFEVGAFLFGVLKNQGV